MQDRPYTDLFTAASGTCPTFDGTTFTAADCGNAAPTAGVLTDPGLMSQYYANMAFRRVRFIQEAFVCSPFPAEYTSNTKPMGAGTYTSPWGFDSITGGSSAKIKLSGHVRDHLRELSHHPQSHRASVRSLRHERAVRSNNFQVLVPVPGNPIATLADWLPAGQGFAWRDGTSVTDIPSLGKAIAADPDVARCAVNRVWDFAMSRGDIVNDLATIPPVVTDPIVSDFNAGGMKLKSVIRKSSPPTTSRSSERKKGDKP